MRLHDFIRTNHEEILAEWETFARTCVPASVTMDVDALRDHASEMLRTIASEISEPQEGAGSAQAGVGQAAPPAQLTAAEHHGAGRAESGFSVEQMVAEYRALRVSVLRLWCRQGALVLEDLGDVVRFNEALDRSLAESITEFNQNIEHAKELFLAMLGHDLRNPLGAIYSSAKFMLDTGELKEPHLTLTSRIADGATRMSSLVGDLLDFTRGRLGGGIPINRAEVNLGRVLRDVVDEISDAHPHVRVEVDTRKEATGEWDAARLHQALSNLLVNAVEHGVRGALIRVAIAGDEDRIRIAIHNRGAAIPAESLDGIFNPMKMRVKPVASAQGRGGNLGLGLHIAERIVHAHGGRIEVESSEERGTTFTVELPRRAEQRDRGPSSGS